MQCHWRVKKVTGDGVVGKDILADIDKVMG